ncbi:MAG: LysR family transcriptional regulator [Myxococcota bacterium]|nr:LysR family transcriptional regulator [Myxococcota bacterium]
MDLDSLRCFDAVATTLNFRAAAARVHLSPAAFSDRIRRLEEDLGRSLLARTTRKVALSDHGRELLPRVREVLAGVDRLRMTGDSKPLPFELVIGTRYELGLSWLCPSLTALSRARPERTVHLYNGDTPDLRARLERGELDAVVGSMRLTSTGLAYAALHDEDYTFVGQKVRLRGASDASSLTLVDVTGDLPLFRYFLDALPGGEPWTFKRVEYMGGIAAIRRRLLDGDGRVAVLPTYFIRDDLRTKRLVRLMSRVRPRSDAFRLVWRAGHPRESELLALAGELREIPLR